MIIIIIIIIPQDDDDIINVNELVWRCVMLSFNMNIQSVPHSKHSLSRS